MARIQASKLNITDEVRFNQLVKDFARSLASQGKSTKDTSGDNETPKVKPKQSVTDTLKGINTSIATEG